MDPAALTISDERDAEIIFDSEMAALPGALGVCLVDANGTARDPRIVFPQIEQVDSVDAFRSIARATHTLSTILGKSPYCTVRIRSV